jgi:sulfhydrogenase subunit beta (sulfur reductase)
VLSVALDSKNLKSFVASMLKQAYRVRGPVKDSSASCAVLADLSSKSELSFDFANFKLPVKREFFPQCEVISRFDAAGSHAETPAEEAVVIFGVRPCDSLSLSFLDKVFVDEQYSDPYYQKRRDNTLVVSMACNSPAATCFCTSIGGSPNSAKGSDIIMFNLGNSFLLESVSKKGEAFLTKNQKMFREPTSKELQKRKQQEESAEKQVGKVNASATPASLLKKNDSALWDEIAETCLSCGACTFLCPTCHCFDFFDEKQGDGGTRVRVHDACMFATFTREASGHNPRGLKRDRMRQRIMHKFSYAPENFNEMFCVGCGRCIVNCPSNIDIRETITKVNA